MVTKPSGAPARSAGATCLARIVAWGQTKLHWLHWMQFSGIHFGHSTAMPRFSSRAVPVGMAPSKGILETGSESPLNRVTGSMTSLAKASASSGMIFVTGADLVILAGTGTASRAAEARSMESQFIWTTSLPLRP